MKVKILDVDLLRIYGPTPDFSEAQAKALISRGKAVPLNSTPAKSKMPSAKSKVLYTVPGEKNSNLSLEMRNRSELKGSEGKIVWIQDFKKIGGAELSNQVVVNVGKSLSYNIDVMTPENFSQYILKNASLIILNNIFTFSYPQMCCILAACHEQKIPYVKYDHDYRELGRIKFAIPLFRHAKLCVFMSPAQADRMCSVLDIKKYVTLPLAIDGDVWKYKPGTRRRKDIVVNTSGKLQSKGMMNTKSFVDAHPEYKYVFYTEKNDIVKQLFVGNRNVELKDKVDNHELVAVYSGVGHLLHLPSEPCPGERTLIEASLCGCNIITNDNAGHNSWGWDWQKDRSKIRKEVKEAPIEFWNYIQEIMDESNR